MMQSARKVSPEIHLTSDAYGKWGCGAFCNQSWFPLQWPNEMENAHITIKKLVPVVLAAAVWGKEWSGRTVQANCDNVAVGAILTQRLAKTLTSCTLLGACHFSKRSGTL